MAKLAQMGEIRTWSDGRKYQKTANGWVPVKSGSKGNAEQKEEPVKGKSSKGDLKLKDGWNEHLSLDSVPSEYKKAAEALAKKFPDIEFSVFSKNGEAYIADATLKSSRGYLEMEFDPDGGMTIDRRDNNKEPQDTMDANVYHLDDRQVQEALEYIGYYDDDEDGEVEEDTFEMIDPSEVNDVSELYDKVPGLSDNAIDAQFDENYEYYKEEMDSSEEDDIFSEALADTVRWVNKQGLKASKEQENEGSGNESGKDSESNPSNEDQSYSPEQLADFAKSASDEGLKRAASSGDEQMRIAAKREIARRKNEGMENDTDNPFDKGSIRKSQREERIYKGQVYEKIDGGWVKKKISDGFEKGKAGQLGEIRTWGGKKYQKTTNGWRPVSKSSQSEKSNEELTEEKALKHDNEWAKTIREYTACGGGNFGKVLEKKPNGDLLVEYIRRDEKPWIDVAKKGSEDWKHLKDEKSSSKK